MGRPAKTNTFEIKTFVIIGRPKAKNLTVTKEQAKHLKIGDSVTLKNGEVSQAYIIDTMIDTPNACDLGLNPVKG